MDWKNGGVELNSLFEVELWMRIRVAGKADGIFAFEIYMSRSLE
jgi:hypothetical protein